MRNLDKYAAVLCEQFARGDTCCFSYDCSACELRGICCDEEELLAFMMQPAADDDQQLLREPQGTV